MEFVFFIKRDAAAEQPPKTIALTPRRATIIAMVLLVLLVGGIYSAAREISEYWLRTRAPIALSIANDMQKHADERRQKQWTAQVEALSKQIALLRARIIELQIKGSVLAERAGIGDKSFFDVAAVGCESYLAPAVAAEPDDAFIAAIKKDFPPTDTEALPHKPPSMQCYDNTLAAVERKYDILLKHGARSFVSYDTVPLERPILGSNWRTSRFGMRRDPITGRRAFHGGYDYAARRGTPIIAAATGVVTYAGRLGNYGKAVRILHGNSISTLYGHMHSITVKPGQYVKRGQRIGGVGNTGRSTGPHLHYEVRVGNRQRPVASEIRKIRKNRGVPSEWKI